MRILAFLLVVLTLLAGSPDTAVAGPAAQGPSTSAPQPSSKAKWVGLAVGAGAGLGLGVLAGFQWFDDARFAERKIGTTMVVFSVSGGVGGYLIGRAWGRKGRK